MKIKLSSIAYILINILNHTTYLTLSFIIKCTIKKRNDVLMIKETKSSLLISIYYLYVICYILILILIYYILYVILFVLPTTIRFKLDRK